MSILKKDEPMLYEVNDKPLVCHNCKNEYFYVRSALLNTGAAEFFGLAWANRSAHCLVCSKCSYIHWFLSK